ncbi:MAG: oligoribonuclease [Gammaproteobacteria bacterium]|nr:oligoribonuclease [Gammaproteobacteria bacterium]
MSNIFKAKYLCWIDCEMTGLNPMSDQILEICLVLTDHSFNIIDQYETVIHCAEDRLLAMDDWNRQQHSKSGLWSEVIASTVDSITAQDLIIAWLKNYMVAGEAILCGNSVYQDRFFLKMHMPKLDQFFHYRLIDVSTLKQLIPIWFPAFEGYKKLTNAHRARQDILESIAELKYCRDFLGAL